MQFHDGRRALGLIGDDRDALASLQDGCDALDLTLVGVLSHPEHDPIDDRQLSAALHDLNAEGVDYLVVNRFGPETALERAVGGVVPRSAPLVVLNGRKAGARA